MISVYVYFQLKLENAKSEEELIDEWEKMNVQKIYLQNASKVELKYILERMVDKGYKRLMIKILQDPRMRIPDYYEMLVLLEKEGWEEVHKMYVGLIRVKVHMNRFLEKRRVQMETKIGYYVKRVESEEEECSFCLDMLQNKMIECKTCRLKIDVKCWKKWVFEGKNQCLMCRSLWFHDGNIKEVLKWTDYASLDL
jgi:hypothetical protein